MRVYLCGGDAFEILRRRVPEDRTDLLDLVLLSAFTVHSFGFQVLGCRLRASGLWISISSIWLEPQGAGLVGHEASSSWA